MVGPRLSAALRSPVFWMLAAYAVFRVILIRVRFFDTDEFEHMHAAWCIAQGQLIYRDFFEHHGPLFPAALSPIFLLVQDPLRCMWAGRALMALLWGGLFAVEWRLPPPKGVDPRVFRAASLLFLLSFTIAAQKSLEIRPDVPAALLVAVALLLSLRERTVRRALATGLCVGVALLLTPKAAYASAGLLAGALLESGNRESQHRPRSGAIAGGALLGILLPIAATVAFFAAMGSLRELYASLWEFNRNFRSHFSVWIFLAPTLQRNPVLWLFALGGLGVERRRLPLVLGLLGAVSGLFLVPVPYFQNYLFVAPFLAPVAAAAFAALVRGGAAAAPRRRRAAFALLALVLAPSVLLQVRTRPSLLETQIGDIRCLERLTGPGDAVFDVWTGVSFFRPHAYSIWMLHQEIVRMLDRRQLVTGVLKSLEDPGTRALIGGTYFEGLPSPILQFARSHYVESGCGRILMRKPDETGGGAGPAGPEAGARR